MELANFPAQLSPSQGHAAGFVLLFCLRRPGWHSAGGTCSAHWRVFQRMKFQALEKNSGG